MTFLEFTSFNQATSSCQETVRNERQPVIKIYFKVWEIFVHLAYFSQHLLCFRLGDQITDVWRAHRLRYNTSILDSETHIPAFAAANDAVTILSASVRPSDTTASLRTFVSACVCTNRCASLLLTSRPT